jgi:hypothetical protein
MRVLLKWNQTRHEISGSAITPYFFNSSKKIYLRRFYNLILSLKIRIVIILCFYDHHQRVVFAKEIFGKMSGAYVIAFCTSCIIVKIIVGDIQATAIPRIPNHCL